VFHFGFGGGDMGRPASYNTKQREAVLAYIASLDGGHVTAARIVEHFENENAPIGRTTIYRHLDKLVESGKIHKYNIDDVSGACFAYVSHGTECGEHFHLKCEDCGELFHLQCDTLSEMQRHILAEHAFKVNTMKTVFYGKCDNCLQNE